MQPDNLIFEIEQIAKNTDRVKVKALSGEKIIHIDTFNLYSDRNRSIFIKKVSEVAGISKELIADSFMQVINRYEKSKIETNFPAVENPLDNVPDDVKQQAIGMLKNPDLMETISKDIEEIGVAGEKDLRQQLYLIMTSRILDKPLSCIIFGASASGKSYALETVAKLMPDESVIHAHDITQEALYYMPKNSLAHKIVIAGERTEDKNAKTGKAEDNTKALREMLASGKLSKMVTVKDSGGQLITKIIEQSGPIAYLESTTLTSIHDEDATRLLPLITDESAAQTDIVMNATKQQAIGKTVDKNKIDTTILKHKTAQRLLKPFRVVIPFAESLKLPNTVVASRRAINQLISFIRSVALLKQYQKEVKSENTDLYIEADTTDYKIAYNLISTIFARTYSPINQKSRELLSVMQDRTKDLSNGFSECTIQQLESWVGISSASVRRRLKELIFTGIVSENKESKPYSYKLDNLDLADCGNVNLISPEEIEERIAIKEY
jgi:hypothetical protein